MSERRYFGWLTFLHPRWLVRTVKIRTLLAAGAVGVLLVVIFISIGGVDVSASRPDSALTRNVLHYTFKRSIASRSRQVQPPDDLSSQGRIQLGVLQYDSVCANCHGAPGIGQSAIALSMSPRPQYLPSVIQQFTDSELHAIVTDGVKFSAMPSWPAATRDDEVWSVVAFLTQLPTMDAKTYLSLTAPRLTAEQTPLIPLGDAIALRPSDTDRNMAPTNEFLYAAPAIGFGDRALHTRPIAACAGCHGVDGDGAATGGEAPNLTLHDAPYLSAALDAYSRGERKSGFMQEVTSQLSSQQIQQLADYYAHLPVHVTPTTTPPNADLVKLGGTIAREGIVQHAIAACANCHESAGAKLGGAPPIAGQNHTFLKRQLTVMRHDGRGKTGDGWNPMYAEARDLDDRDISGLAAYYAALKPGKGGDRLAASAAWPQGDLASGQHVFASVCITCHINGGRGDDPALIPNITLQAAPYVAQQLYDFRSRTRENNRMMEVVDSLTYADMASVAVYLNALAPLGAQASVDQASASRGARLAENGDSARHLAACVSCHGAEGVAALPLIPHLQGEGVRYLQARLDLFARARKNEISALNPMPLMASKLTAQERADLAAYFATAAPLPKPHAPVN